MPSAAKSNKSHYQSKVFVCVSVISGEYADYCADAVDRLLIEEIVEQRVKIYIKVWVNDFTNYVGEMMLRSECSWAKGAKHIKIKVRLLISTGI